MDAGLRADARDVVLQRRLHLASRLECTWPLVGGAGWHCNRTATRIPIPAQLIAEQRVSRCTSCRRCCGDAERAGLRSAAVRGRSSAAARRSPAIWSTRSSPAGRRAGCTTCTARPKPRSTSAIGPAPLRRRARRCLSAIRSGTPLCTYSTTPANRRRWECRANCTSRVSAWRWAI